MPEGILGLEKKTFLKLETSKNPVFWEKSQCRKFQKETDKVREMFFPNRKLFQNENFRPSEILFRNSQSVPKNIGLFHKY